jgi:uncharacterized protein involved in outer membrane biogenesis
MVKWVLKVLLWAVLAIVVIFGVGLAVLLSRQEAIVKELIETANADFRGRISIAGSHIEPFVNFPYISVDLEEFSVFESKDDSAAAVLTMHDVYVGFDLFTLITGDFEIRSIKLSDGFIDIVQYSDDSLNITNAFAPLVEVEDTGEEFHMNLKRIALENVAISKNNLNSGLKIDAVVATATSYFKSSDTYVKSGLTSDLTLTIIQSGDTAFVKHKPIFIDTDFRFDNATQVLTFEPSIVRLRNAEFNMSGSIDLDDSANLDLTFEGAKDDFDLLMAFAPDDLAPTLERYANQGDIFFKADVKGKAINGHSPYFKGEFGCRDGFFNNTTTAKKLDDMQFNGYFTNGDSLNTRTMEFALNSFSARPEAGRFSGRLVVKNFDAPDIDLQLDSDFNLEFLAKFLNVEQLQDLTGHVVLKMNFHDIIDLENPETSIERLNESYFTELEVTDLGFKMPEYHLPISDVNIRMSMEGHEAVIEQFTFKAGESDLAITGSIDDLPAIIHHTDIPTEAKLKLRSTRLNLGELAGPPSDSSAQAIKEILTDLRLDLRFDASARAFTESKTLPIGEFFIDGLDVTMNHYPHRLHDFKADVLIDEADFSIIDFSGLVDSTDFHFSGKLTHYDLWFDEKPNGDTRVDFNLVSNLIQLHDLFSYNGENFVPEDYRHEAITNMRLKGHAELHYTDSLRSADVYIDDLQGKMKMHPMALKDFAGRFHFEDGRLVVDRFRGRMGNSSFTADLNCTLKSLQAGADHSNRLVFKATHLDLDQLLAWEPNPNDTVVDHDAVFSVFDMPFPNLDVQLDIEKVTYHTYKIEKIKGKLSTTKDHRMTLNDLSLDIAGGNVVANGYFTGEDRTKIYLNPNFRFTNIDLDKLLLKFDNFGQDAIVAENLHGYISGLMTGKIHMHADLVPIIDDSQIHLEVEVVNGRLDNYEPMLALADYFQDRNLNRVLFDTLRNEIDVVNGVTKIPLMRVNSSLGFIELSGQQDFDLNMDYIIRVPWQLITQTASRKLFGGKQKEEADGDDEIVQDDPTRRTRFVNVRMTGTPDEFDIELVGRKKALSQK